MTRVGRSPRALNLLVAFREGIDALEWMSPATKLEAQKKLATFTVPSAV